MFLTNIRTDGQRGRSRIMNLSGKLVTFAPPFYSADLFDPTDEIERREIERLFVEQSFRCDEVIFEQDSAPASVWKVVSGTAVLSRCDGRSDIARVIHSGEILGLTETIAGMPFDATLRTLSSCVCERMDGQGLIRLLHRRPLIRQRIVTVLAKNYGDALARAADARQFV